MESGVRRQAGAAIAMAVFALTSPGAFGGQRGCAVTNSGVVYFGNNP